MMSLIMLYELRKTMLESGICGFMSSTNVFKLRLNNWAAWFNISMHSPSLFAVTIGLHPNGFTDITTIFLAPKLYNFCVIIHPFLSNQFKTTLLNYILIIVLWIEKKQTLSWVDKVAVRLAVKVWRVISWGSELVRK